MVWNNRTRVFHGTTETFANNIRTSKPNPSLSRVAADFGKGFYVTSNAHQARQWANQKVRSRPGAPVRAAVVEFEMNWDWPATPKFDVLSFALDDTPFHDFVVFNRLAGVGLGSVSHGRGAGGPFDIVVGPVAAYPQTLTYANCDQICFVDAGRNVKAALKCLTYVTIILPTNPTYF
jgi:hypothetical protein